MTATKAVFGRSMYRFFFQLFMFTKKLVFLSPIDGNILTIFFVRLLSLFLIFNNV